MDDSITGIRLLADADRNTIWAHRGMAWADAWTLEAAQRTYTKRLAQMEQDVHQALEAVCEVQAREMGSEKGIRFRRYRHWRPCPIKAYEVYGWTGSDLREAPDFMTWKEALEWIKGQ